jgi:hypothetical protein
MASKQSSKPPAISSRIAFEIEQRLHQVGVVGHRVDHLDLHAADGLAPDVVERDIGSIDDAVAGQFAAAGEDGIGDSSPAPARRCRCCT